MRRGWIWGGLLDPPDYMHFGKVTLGEEANPLAAARSGQANCNSRPIEIARRRDALARVAGPIDWGALQA